MIATPDRRLRLFFALWADEPARAALADLATRVARDRGGRATAAGNVHVTLAFLGAVETGLLPLVEAAGAAAAIAVAPFTVTFDRPGGTTRGAIAWLGCRDPAAGLATLHGSLRDALAARGLPVERRAFRPHVTLARGCHRPPGRRPAAAVTWQANRLALVASAPGPGGSAYRTVADWPLGAIGTSHP